MAKRLNIRATSTQTAAEQRRKREAAAAARAERRDQERQAQFEAGREARSSDRAERERQRQESARTEKEREQSTLPAEFIGPLNRNQKREETPKSREAAVNEARAGFAVQVREKARETSPFGIKGFLPSRGRLSQAAIKLEEGKPLSNDDARELKAAGFKQSEIDLFREKRTISDREFASAVFKNFQEIGLIALSFGQLPGAGRVSVAPERVKEPAKKPATPKKPAPDAPKVDPFKLPEVPIKPTRRPAPAKPEPIPIKEPAKTPARPARPNPSKKPRGPQPAKKPTRPRPKPGKQPKPKRPPVKKPEPVKEPAPRKQPAKKPEPVKEPAPRRKPAPKPSRTPAPFPQPDQFPVVSPQRGPQPASKPLPSPGRTTGSQPAPAGRTSPAPGPQPSPGPQPEPGSEPQPEPIGPGPIGPAIDTGPAPLVPPPPGQGPVPTPNPVPTPADGKKRGRSVPPGAQKIGTIKLPKGQNPSEVTFRTGIVERRENLLTGERTFGRDLSPKVPNNPKIKPRKSIRITDTTPRTVQYPVVVPFFNRRNLVIRKQDPRTVTLSLTRQSRSPRKKKLIKTRRERR